MEPFVQFYNSLDPRKKEEYVRSLTIATEYFEKEYVVVISSPSTNSDNQQNAYEEIKNLSTRSK
jgi:hypothetical protein